MFALQDQNSSRVPGRRMTKKKDGALGIIFLHLFINTSRMTGEVQRWHCVCHVKT